MSCLQEIHDACGCAQFENAIDVAAQAIYAKFRESYYARFREILHPESLGGRCVE